MSNNQTFTATGIVAENLPNTMFRIKVVTSSEPDMIDKVILCTLSGKMRINWVRLLPGDKVQVDISTLDTTKGRITYKIKN